MAARRSTPLLQFVTRRPDLLPLEVLERFEDVDLALPQLPEILIPQPMQVLHFTFVGRTHCPLLSHLLPTHTPPPLLLLLRLRSSDAVVQNFCLFYFSHPHAVPLLSLQNVPECDGCYTFSEKERLWAWERLGCDSGDRYGLDLRNCTGVPCIFLFVVGFLVSYSDSMLL